MYLFNLVFILLISAVISNPQGTPTKTKQTEQGVALPAVPAGKPLLPADIFDQDFYVPFRSDAHDHFSLLLIKQIAREQQNKNVIISPFSVKLMLSTLSEAAGNNTLTQKELISTLTDLRLTDNLRNFYKKNLQALQQKNPYYTLNLATKIFTSNLIEPQQRFAALVHEYYDTDIQRLNFDNAAEAAKIINDWSSKETEGKLANLVNENQIKNSEMIMTNVIYFNGLWRRPFENIYEGVFLKSAKEQVHAQFMEITDYFYYHNNAELNTKILRVPYKGHQYSMFFLLPKQELPVDQLIEQLTDESLKRMQLLMEDVQVKVTVPKFKFEFEHNLVNTLRILGINDVFSDQASLPGLARGAGVAKRLKVTNMFQKAGIEVTENGTEIYAATVVEIANKFGGPTIIEEFNINRPFLFFIEEESTGNIIFAGKVVEPLL